MKSLLFAVLLLVVIGVSAQTHKNSGNAGSPSVGNVTRLLIGLEKSWRRLSWREI
jgi:hypothetical protein